MTPTQTPPRFSPLLISTLVAALLSVLLVAVTPASGSPSISSISVTIASPAANATVTGDASWLATVSGNAKTVDFYIDGTFKWTELRAPYQYHGDNTSGLLETSKLANGAHELEVVAQAPNGTTATARTVVNVTNGVPPSVSIAAPASGATLSGVTIWDAAASGTITRVVFLVDGAQKWVENSTPYRYNSDGRFDTTTLADGQHTLGVRAEGLRGSSASSITVNVANKQTIVSSSPPVNADPPVVSGTAAVGQTLSATTGSWSGTAPLAFASAWERCVNSTCGAIAGATAGAYLITSADAGASIRAIVTAKNGAGSATARSAQTAAAQTASSSPITQLNTSVGTALPDRMPESTGTNYYVDGTSGSDSNQGSLSAPWRTINNALATVPLSGSIINVRAGTYLGMHQLVNRYGSPSNPITLQPYPGEKVTLAAPPNAQLHAFLVSNGGGLRLRGFEITSATALDGVKVENGKDVEIVGNEIHHTGRQGITVAGSGTVAPTGSRNIQIWNNRFHDNGGYWAAGDHSIYWGAVGSNTDGIDHTTYGGVIANNLFYSQPYGFQLQIGSQASGLIVTNNTFYRATAAAPAGGSIVLYTETTTPAYVTRNVLVVNNLITQAANYGVYGSGGGGLMSTNLVRNNLAYGNAHGDYLRYYGSTSNVLFTLGTNVSSQNPLFVNPTGLDFRLQSGSPAVGNADPAYAPPTDFAGRGRSGAPDLGAFES